MARLAHIDDLKAALRGVDLSAWSQGQAGNDTTQLDAALESALLSAESEVEGFTGASFAPLQQWTDTLSGKGGASVRVKRSPVVDVLDLSVRSAPIGGFTTLPASAWRLDRATGAVVIQPSAMAAAGASVPAGLYAYTFPFGHSNVVARYRTGFAAVGDNVASSVLADDPWPRVAAVSTDASFAYLELPERYGLFKVSTTIATRGAGKVLKNGADDSVNWTMETPTRLRCPIAAYSSIAKYVFVFVPAGVSDAVVELAHADMLRAKGSNDVGGTGGAISLSAGPFSESYGEFPYAKTIESLVASAQSKLRAFKRALIA